MILPIYEHAESPVVVEEKRNGWSVVVKGSRKYGVCAGKLTVEVTRGSHRGKIVVKYPSVGASSRAITGSVPVQRILSVTF